MKTCRLVPSLSIILLLVLSACSLVGGTTDNSSAPTPDTQGIVDTAIAATRAIETQIAISVQQTLASGQGGAPQPTDTPRPPDAPLSTNTISTVTVTVSINTNCRTGPGTAYPLIGALAVGQTAEVVGRSHNSDNWIIKNPNGYGTCWLWGQYATAVGNTGALPVIQPPPTPTPTTPPNISITIHNNTGVTIFYAYISLSTSSNWGEDLLGASTITHGSAHTFEVPHGVYDIKVEDSLHNVLRTWFSLDLSTATYLITNP